ncbi:hypothetical protein LTR36_000893 [Oleoguttula mirabilis]|uniref:FHA domain-containing protein n=1 Tax=Oleoguttula mirabilis TaxID=1507867 RepID=A0AAV9J3I0_9PEZI|nr:hypothetical protein LTR36_000893 [Oleoguttula mirabilis]
MEYADARAAYELYNSSPYTLNNTQTPTMQSYHSIPITLTSVRNPSDRRQLVISAGERVTIGRASSSEAKDLHASSDNALFDCPVVSRQHAELKAHPFRAVEEQVTITDRESMHGTCVNGTRLAPYVPFSLKSGDLIKFGEKVVRGPGKTITRTLLISQSTDTSRSDTHDGVIVTFGRSATTTKPYSRPLPPASSSRGFHVPSDSENDSDDASDNESIMSEQEKITSSAKTTPEQTKPALGTQQQPIEIETDHVAPKEIIDLEDDYVPPSAQELSTEVKAVQDTYAESEDAESVHDESEHDEESEDGDAVEDLDNLSDSDASDLSNHYDESGEVSEAEGPELMSSKKQASPELGTPDEIAKPQVHAFWRSYPKPAAPAPMYAPYPQYPTAAARANNCAMSRPPYDPIRGSYPPPLITPQDYNGPRYPAPHCPARAPSAYTYGYPGTFGGPLQSKSATDSYDSSRWDVLPRTSSLPHATTTQPYYACADFTSTATPTYPFIHQSARSADKPYGYGSQQPSSVLGATAGSMRCSSEAVSEPERQTQAASLKSKMSIPDIMDTSSTFSLEEEARPSLEEAMPELVMAMSAASPKRKADAISDVAAEPSTSEWDELYTIYNHVTQPVPAQQTAVKRARTMKRVGADMAKYATVALAGGVGMAVFLASPFAQQLLEL